MKNTERKRDFSLFYILLLILAILLPKGELVAQSKDVSVSVVNTTLKQLFDQIEKSTVYRFAYLDNVLPAENDVTISVNNESIDSFLDQVLSSRGLTYSKTGNTFSISKRTATVRRNVAISGVVKDPAGEPVIGANVIVNGTTTGTVTDYDGNFSLEVPENSRLKISYIGMADMLVDTRGKNYLNVKMSDDSKALEEVVVVGYGVQKKESLTGSMNVVSSNKLKDVTAPTVENMLSGKAPGVNVASGSGRPGEAAAIVIRGKSTINGSTDPLWVVDGVIVGTNSGTLNPADIESISILKDASSTAIYGSQGANGVVLVTTKKGVAGKATVQVDAKMAATFLNSGNFEVMDGAELYDYYKTFANQSTINFPRWNEDLRNSNFNWWDNATKTGLAQDYNISIMGGVENMKTFFSLGLYDETGAVKGYDFNRYSFRFKTDYTPKKWLTIKPQVSGSMKQVDNKEHSVSAMYLNLPWDSPYKEDGTLVGNAPNPTWVNTTGSNYLYDLQWNFSNSKTYDFMGGFDFDLNLTKNLTFRSINNYKYTNYSSVTYSDPRSSSALSVNGRINDYQYISTRMYTNQLLQYSNRFGKHDVNGILAYEWNESSVKANRGIATGFAPGFEVADVAAVPEKVGSSINEWAVQSVLFRGNYNYDNRYLGEVSFRRDGASNFGDNAKYGNFFSVSGGWLINRENFFSAEWVDQLKLRASYGSVGNRPGDYYGHYTLYSLSGKYNEMPGAIISQPGNADMTWEKTYTAGVGVDFRMFRRYNFTFDYYDKNTTDLLYRVTLPGIIGVSSRWQNVGSLKNRGFEFTASADIINKNDFFWSVEANIGLNRNEISELYGGKSEVIVGDGTGIAGSANKIWKPGLDSDTWYLTEWAGVDPANGDPLWFMTDENGNRVKTNDYGQASKNPVACGSYTPDFFGGFSTYFSWKNLDLSANFTYSVGGDIYNYSRAEFDSDGAYTDRNQMKLQKGWSRWEKEGDVATHPLARYNNNSNSQKASSRFLEDGSYLKLRNVTVSYNLALPKWHIQNIKLFASGENLFTITKFSGVDPEIPPYDGKITGVATTVYPSTRKVVFGLSLTL
ncbi:MAG: TonB-dependent receptor [Bacteroidales bacterium]